MSMKLEYLCDDELSLYYAEQTGNHLTRNTLVRILLIKMIRLFALNFEVVIVELANYGLTNSEIYSSKTNCTQKFFF